MAPYKGIIFHNELGDVDTIIHYLSNKSDIDIEFVIKSRPLSELSDKDRDIDIFILNNKAVSFDNLFFMLPNLETRQIKSIFKEALDKAIIFAQYKNMRYSLVNLHV